MTNSNIEPPKVSPLWLILALAALGLIALAFHNFN